MSMSVEERLRRYAEDLDGAAAAYSSPAVDQPTSNVVQLDVINRTSTRPGPRRILLVAAAILLIGGAVTVLARRELHKQTADYPALDSHWVVPGPISGYHLWYAQTLDSGLTYQERYRVLVARPIDDGGFFDPVTITIGDRWRIWIDKERVAIYAPEATAVAGTTGEFVEDTLNRTLVLQYAVGNGDVVVLGMRNPVPASRQTLLDLAQAVLPTNEGTLASPAELPDGYQVLAAMKMHHFFGAAPLLTFIDDDTRTSIINIETEAATPPPNYELYKMQEILEPVEVRGVTGWFTTDRTSTTGQPTGGSMFWREPTGEVITINWSDGKNSPGRSALKAELLKIANDLRTVSETEWRVVAGQADETGAGLGEMAGPVQVAFPKTPDGYQLDSAELQPLGDQYGLARYVPFDPSSGLPIIEIRLHNLSPEDWDRMLAIQLAGRERMQANGRMLIDGGTGPGAGETANQRSAAFEWVTNVVVEIVVSMPDGSPPTATFADLAELANQLNGVTFFNRYGSEESLSSSGEGPSTTLAADEPQLSPDPAGVVTFATTDNANTTRPSER